MKKLFLGVIEGQEGYSFAELFDIPQLIRYFSNDNEILSWVPGKFDSLRIEVHHSSESTLNPRSYTYGDDRSMIIHGDLNTHEGLYIEVDRKLVHNSLKPCKGHNPECFICKTEEN